jgi:DNA-binding transcriptional ArsR family regulator
MSHQCLHLRISTTTPGLQHGRAPPFDGAIDFFDPVDYSQYVRTKRPALAAIRVMSNPTAFRLLAVIGMRGPQTTGEIARVLADVPTSSLYRQLSRLRKAGVLRVIAERRARGAVERTYALSSREAGALQPADLAGLPIAQLRSTFRNLLATMVADASGYIESPAFSRDRTLMRAGLAVCKLTDEEYVKVMYDVGAAITQYKERSEAPPTAKRRRFYIFALPEASQ